MWELEQGSLLKSIWVEISGEGTRDSVIGIYCRQLGQKEGTGEREFSKKIMNLAWRGDTVEM